MKKMIPVYVLLTAMLAALITFGFLLLRKAEAIRVAVAPAPSPYHEPRPMRVEVVNTPTVELETPITPIPVTVDEPLSVNVHNEPLEVQIVQ